MLHQASSAAIAIGTNAAPWPLEKNRLIFYFSQSATGRGTPQKIYVQCSSDGESASSRFSN
jgi:hypothetical protein